MSLPVSMTGHLATAQNNVDLVMAEGHDVVLLKASSKDKGGHPIVESSLPLKSFPIEFAPFDRQTSARVSWSEEVEVLFCVAAKNLTINKIKQYDLIEYDKVRYNIMYTALDGSFANTHLYILIGGKK